MVKRLSERFPRQNDIKAQAIHDVLTSILGRFDRKDADKGLSMTKSVVTHFRRYLGV